MVQEDRGGSGSVKTMGRGKKSGKKDDPGSTHREREIQHVRKSFFCTQIKNRGRELTKGAIERVKGEHAQLWAKGNR